MEIYKHRWLIETDLRSIKCTSHLDTVQAKTPEVAKNEIILGVTGYTLVRAITAHAAKRQGLEPRKISYSRARSTIANAAIRLSRVTSADELQRVIKNFHDGIRQIKLPDRKNVRIEPRALASVWRRKFPKLKTSREEARKDILNKRISDA